MDVSVAKSILGRIAAALGILQGVAWTFLTLIAIILHHWQTELETPSSYEETLEYLIYYQFIADGGDTDSSKFIFTPAHFSIMMWIYFVLSVLWTGLSIDNYTAIQFKKKRQTTTTRLWAGVTVFISLVDLIFTVLLAEDYVTCESNYSTTTATQSTYFCFLSVGIIMTLAARGYTLWALNMVFSVILLKRARTIPTGSDGAESVYSTIPRAKLVTRSISQRVQ